MQIDFQTIILSIGTPSILLALLYIGRKLQVLDNVEKDVNNIESDIKIIRDKVIISEEKIGILWKERFAPSSSPRKLNDRGESILTESGIDRIIESKKTDLLEIIRKLDLKNAYDAESAIENTVRQIPQLYPETLEAIKQGAFNTGTDIEVVLFVGSIHLRNLIFKELGFVLDDLDKPANLVIGN